MASTRRYVARGLAVHMWRPPMLEPHAMGYSMVMGGYSLLITIVTPAVVLANSS